MGCGGTDCDTVRELEGTRRDTSGEAPTVTWVERDVGDTEGWSLWGDTLCRGWRGCRGMHCVTGVRGDHAVPPVEGDARESTMSPMEGLQRDTAWQWGGGYVL